jgi:hypothetical protein
MPTATITANDIIARYADDIAYVAEEDRATDLDAFIDQLGTATWRLGMARINDYEDLETAAVDLDEARSSSDDTDGSVFLRRADKLLKNLGEMAQEYREMVGD